jgi:surface antigen
MRSRGISRVLCCAALATGVILSNKPSVAANCALYVRAETGVALYGAAGGWWNEAEGRYERGQAPAAGAILVFKRTGHMRSGHVALVAKVVSAHEIVVDHANWYHGTVSRGMSVIDTSPNHDWTTVAVMELRSGKHGRDNPTFGFIYPQAGLRDIVDASASPAGLFHLASAEYGTPAAPERKRGWTTHRTHAAFAAPTRRADADRPVD